MLLTHTPVNKKNRFFLTYYRIMAHLTDFIPRMGQIRPEFRFLGKTPATKPVA